MSFNQQTTIPLPLASLCNTKKQGYQIWILSAVAISVGLFCNTSFSADDVQILKQNVSECQKKVRKYEKKSDPKEWAEAQFDLGDALENLAKKSKEKEAVHCLKMAEKSYQNGLLIYTPKEDPLSWGAGKVSLASVYMQLALTKVKRVEDFPEANILFKKIRGLCQDAIKVYSKEDHPEERKMVLDLQKDIAELIEMTSKD